MRRIPGIRLLPRIATSARAIERDVDAEMRFHIQMRVEDLMRDGRSRADAESEAHREFGDLIAARRELSEIDRRAARHAGWRELASSIVNDVRISVRSLRARPGFTAAVLLTLALGIGANTAIFSVTYAVLVKPLPFVQPDRLVHLWETFDGVVETRSEASYPDYADFRTQTRGLTGIAGYQTNGALIGAEHPTNVRAGTVTANFFDVIGARPMLGRTFLDGEDAVGAPRVVVLTEGLWEQQFARDPGVIGRTIILNAQPTTVIGVLPRSFQFGGRAGTPQLWIPITNDGIREVRGAHWLNLIGRLRPGVTVDEASRDLARIMRDLAALYPRTNSKRSAMAVPLRDELVGSVRPLLLALYGAVAAVLLVACANVANLVLMRGTDREREIAVRVALGAGRGRLVRQLLTESMLLAFGGGVLALLLAQMGIRAIIGAIPSRTVDSLPALSTVGIDTTLVVYAMLVSIVAGLIFGVAPALRATRTSIHDLLKQGSKGSSARGRLRDSLIVAEIALTVVLVSGATLFAKSLGKLLAIDLGFRPARITTAGILLSGSDRDPVRSVQVFDRLTASMRALPGVESVGLVSRLPLNAGETWDFEIAGRPRSAPGQGPSGSIRWVAGDYFQTLGISLVRGRTIMPADNATAPRIVVINEAFARRYFPGIDALGQTIVRNADSLRIVGIVRDVPIGKLEDKVPPTWYVPLAQAPQGYMRIAIRSERASADLVRQLSTALGTIAPSAAVVDPATMNDLLIRSPSVFTRRFPLLLIGTFAVTALVLALVGIYGVVSYSVGQQRRELGIRLALGAEPRGVIALFLRRAASMAAIGAIAGIAAALVAARFVTGMLYGVEANDPATYTGAALLLGATALVATFVPALRATRIDPTITLRAE